MDFRVEQHIEAAPDTVAAALVDADFVAATSALGPLGDCRLLDVEVTPGRWRSRIHRRFAASLPAAVTAVVDPQRLTWIEEVDYDPSQRRGTHRIVPEHYPRLLACSWTSELHASPGGATARQAAGTLRARVLVGARQVERAIVSGLEEYARAETELLSRWGRDATGAG